MSTLKQYFLCSREDNNIFDHHQKISETQYSFANETFEVANVNEIMFVFAEWLN